MSLSTQTLKRLPKIKDGLIKGRNREQIGKECGVTEKTIDRDISAWVQSGFFEIWIKEEFLRLHPFMLENAPHIAYKEVAKLVGKMLTRRMEVKEEIQVQEEIRMDISVFSDDEKSILDKAARILDRKSQGKPDSIH